MSHGRVRSVFLILCFFIASIFSSSKVRTRENVGKMDKKPAGDNFL